MVSYIEIKLILHVLKYGVTFFNRMTLCFFILFKNEMTSMRERNITNILNQYYKNDHSENERLTKDKAHYIEFITTTHYIDKYLKTGDRILEVGAGTGSYSLYYANKGYQVDALELIKSNIDIMNSNIKDNMNIKTIQGNALELINVRR